MRGQRLTAGDCRTQAQGALPLSKAYPLTDGNLRGQSVFPRFKNSQMNILRCARIVRVSPDGL